MTGIAADLRKLVDKYHTAIDSLQPAEEELMLPELSVTQTSLSPGEIAINILNISIIICDLVPLYVVLFT